jgi:hypothetical protein
MPRVLTTNARIRCPHAGTGTSLPIAQPPKLFIDGGAVLLDGDQGVIGGCGNLVQCGGYQLRSLGLNACFVDGRQVMLVTDFLQSLTGFPLKVEESHPVFDGSTPAPLPPGADPQVPPELREDDQPAATVVPPLAPFSLSAFGTTGQPALLTWTFTIQSQFPRRWTFFHVGPPKVSVDITNGLPPGITVAPGGGAWQTPTLTILLTVTGVFAATLAPGTHSFVLTAINHRGFSAMAEGNLAVSA